jgi:putative transcriptional regulator
MNAFARIRSRLGVSQSAIADGIGVSQGNVSFYEVRDQTVPPDVAGRLIAFAARHGLPIGFDHVYGDAALPKERLPVRQRIAAGK